MYKWIHASQTYVVQGSVITYCCVKFTTNCYKPSSFKQHIFIVLKLLWVRCLGADKLALRFSQSVGCSVYFPGAPGSPPSSCDNRHSLVPCFYEGKTLPQLLRGCSQFFSTRQFLKSSQKTLACFFKSSRINSCSSLLR